MIMNAGVILTLVILCLVTGENNARESKYKLSNNKELRQSFNKLLNSVTNVNQERLDALKKLYELQSYEPTGPRANKLLAVVIPKPREENKGPSYPRGTLKMLDSDEDSYESDSDGSDSDGSYSDESDTQESLRSFDGCNKKAEKYCVSACKKAMKDLCSEYKCQSSMKKLGKKLCKSFCKDEFD